MTKARTISLVVAGVDVALLGLALITGEPRERGFVMIGGGAFLLIGMAFIWFPEKLADFATYMRFFRLWPEKYEPGHIPIVGWAAIGLIVPTIAVLAAFDWL